MVLPSSPGPASSHRDIIVIGASAGGLSPLMTLVRALPGDLPASIFVVVHVSPRHAGALPDLIATESAWRASYPLHGQSVERGMIYVAPPDNHLLVHSGSVEVVRGPKENGHRPAVNALFRTASRAYGQRVIGVVLSGGLDCGTAGLISIKARGGVAIAQAPNDAEQPSMPESAIRHASVDYVASAPELGPLLARLVNEPAPIDVNPIAVREEVAMLEGDAAGEPVQGVCPACDGSLTVVEQGTFQTFRCHVGHTFSGVSLLEAQDSEAERALFAAMRALDDSADLATRMAYKSGGNMRQRYEEQATGHRRDAQAIRDLIKRSMSSSRLAS